MHVRLYMCGCVQGQGRTISATLLRCLPMQQNAAQDVGAALVAPRGSFALRLQRGSYAHQHVGRLHGIGQGCDSQHCRRSNVLRRHAAGRGCGRARVLHGRPVTRAIYCRPLRRGAAGLRARRQAHWLQILRNKGMAADPNLAPKPCPGLPACNIRGGGVSWQVLCAWGPHCGFTLFCCARKMITGSGPELQRAQAPAWL